MIEENSARPCARESGQESHFRSCFVKKDEHPCGHMIDDSVDGMQRKIQEQDLLINQLEYLLMHTEAQCSHWKRIACA